MPLLRAGVSVAAVAGPGFSNIKQMITDCLQEMGGAAVTDGLINSWWSKFYHGRGEKLRPWNETVRTNCLDFK